MFDAFPVVPTLPAADMDRAKRWFSEKLGLEPSTVMGDDACFYPAADTPMGFLLYSSAFAGSSQATSASWAVGDIDEVMAALRARGVVFEEYDLPGVTTTGGVVEIPNGAKTAWFKDSEGNILNITQMPAD